MLAQQVVDVLLRMIRNAIKEEKVALLFCYSEGHPVRPFLRRKIEAEEKVLRGLEAMQRGESSLLAVEGLRATVVAVEELIPRLPPHEGELCHRERTALLDLSQKISALEGLMSEPEEKCTLPVFSSHMN